MLLSTLRGWYHQPGAMGGCPGSLPSACSANALSIVLQGFAVLDIRPKHLTNSWCAPPHSPYVHIDAVLGCGA